jgi:hypothetical protein
VLCESESRVMARGRVCECDDQECNCGIVALVLFGPFVLMLVELLPLFLRDSVRPSPPRRK